MEHTNRLLLKGNEAAVYGALLAGCDCFFGYPITPASEIAHTASLLFPRLGRVFLQAECETASINMVFGAAAAGRRAMTASSGLGISLKQEGVSYMATCELPCVIVDIMRGGPGLGNIGPEQSDYNQVIKGGGHGNYKVIVLAPNSAQEMCEFTMKGFELADKYRTPVYVLSDGIVGQMLESVALPDPVKKPEIPVWALDGSARSRRNYLTSIYLEHDDLEQVNHKLQAKYDTIKKNEQLCEKYFLEDAEVVIVAYGITSRIARTAVKKLRDKGVKAGLLRPITLFPFPLDELKKTLKTAKAYISAEMSNGQMIDDIKLGIECKRPVVLCSRMGGNVPTIDEVMSKTIETLEAAK